MKITRDIAFWAMACLVAPVAFMGGVHFENLNRNEPTGYSLRFLGHEVYCFDENLTIDIYVENTGGTQFTEKDIDQDEWAVSLVGENTASREVSVIRTQYGGFEPGESGYLTAYVGTYQDEFATVKHITLSDFSGEIWTELIDLGPTACLGNV